MILKICRHATPCISQPETAKEKNHHACLPACISINDRSLSLFLLQSPSHKPLGYFSFLDEHARDAMARIESSAPAITLCRRADVLEGSLVFRFARALSVERSVRVYIIVTPRAGRFHKISRESCLKTEMPIAPPLWLPMPWQSPTLLDTHYSFHHHPKKRRSTCLWSTRNIIIYNNNNNNRVSVSFSFHYTH
jgi:hypothetical protein